MTALARGLVWCKSCQVRTALADQGGRCPVCDPSQGNAASARADEILDSIDDVLAGADQSSWDSLAHWSPEQLEDHDDDWKPDGFQRNRIVVVHPRRAGHSDFAVRAREVDLAWRHVVAQVNRSVLERREAMVRQAVMTGTVYVAPAGTRLEDELAGFQSVGYLADPFAFHRAEEDEEIPVVTPGRHVTGATLSFTMTDVNPRLMDLLYGRRRDGLTSWAPGEWATRAVCASVGVLTALRSPEVPYVPVAAILGLPDRRNELEDVLDRMPDWANLPISRVARFR